MKTCPKCNEHLNDSAFALKSGKLASYCKPCQKDYAKSHYQKHKDTYKNKSKQWRKDNPEKYKEQCSEYYKNNRVEFLRKSSEYQRANKEDSNLRKKKWRESNPQTVLKTEQQYRDRNRNKCNERIRTWKRNHLEILSMYAGKRRAAMLKAIPQWANSESILQIYTEARKMTIRSGIKHHVDHIVPLISPIVCGLHCEDNLQIIDGYDNVKKGNRYWPDMP